MVVTRPIVMTKIVSVRQHCFLVTFQGIATIVENQGTKGRTVQRRRNLSLGLEGTMVNATNTVKMGTSSWIVGRMKKTKANSHATGGVQEK